jgi:hypothetical protein
VEPVRPDVLAGRDPAWREAWEDDLDVDQRQRVVHALRTGVRMQDEQLEPFVYGLIARRRRQNRWRLIQIVVALWISGFWTYVTTVVHPSAAKWFWIASFMVALVAMPVLVRAEAKRLDRAEAAQQVRRA